MKAAEGVNCLEDTKDEPVALQSRTGSVRYTYGVLVSAR